MGAAVPFPFISGKALSPCVLLEVEGFRVEEPFPLQLSDEESSAKKDVRSLPWHPVTTSPRWTSVSAPRDANLPRAPLRDHQHVQRGCAAASKAPARPGLLWAHLVGESPHVLPGARPAQLWVLGCSSRRYRRQRPRLQGHRGCRAIVTRLRSLVPQSTPDAAMPPVRATRPSGR